jgi:Protein of unknown function (DUF1161)
MKKCIVFLLLSFVVSPAFAAKDCEELKAEIAAKLDAKSVTGYTLEIIAADAATDLKVVGTCGGGTQKITYKKD